MITKFSVANFLSFKEKVILDLEPTTIREHADDNIASPAPNLEVLKSAVLYGANSSGKSNLLKALEFVKTFIIHSSKDKQVGEKIGVENFKLSDETDDQPSFFEIEFFHIDTKYRYTFSVDEDRVHEEALYYIKKNKEAVYFERKLTDAPVFYGSYSAEAAGLESKIRSNALILSVMAQFSGPISSKIVEWVQNIKFIFDINQDFDHTASLMVDGGQYVAPITKLLVAADLGFKQVQSEKIVITDDMLEGMPKGVREFILSQKTEQVLVRTLHKKYNKKGEVIDDVYLELAKHESLGTRKYFSMAGRIVHALTNNTILIIDELDARLHPLLSALIVKLFNSKENNKNYSQLIFATHNTNLLTQDIFRRDQIWLTKKDETSATTINTLHNEKTKNRNDVSYEKNYLHGIYDAIPKVDIHEVKLFEN